MAEPYQSDLEFARWLAAVAHYIALPNFHGRRHQVTIKPDGSPVTAADCEIERRLRTLIAEEHPGDAVLGEEYGAVGESTRQWVLDPIDGTKQFMRGLPSWGTLIALQEHEQTVVAVVSAPAMGRQWWATRDGGAFTDGRPMRVSRVGRLSNAVLCHGQMRPWAERGMRDRLLTLVDACWHTRGYGDFLQHMFVAEGAADLACEVSSPLWDLAACKLIVEEAGGQFTDFAGVARANGGTALATNGRLHSPALRILAG